MLRCMRTTLTLDEDIWVLLKRIQGQKQVPLKEIVNAALRAGLARMIKPKPRGKPYRTPSISLGRCHLANLDDIAEVLAVAEGEAHK